jgi:DNA recombination protein RmuC
MDTGSAIVVAAVIAGVALIVVAALRRSSPTAQGADVDQVALAAAVRAGVEAEVRRTMADAQQQANAQTQQYFEAQSALLAEQTKGLLQPFEQQVTQLAGSVNNLNQSYAESRGTVGQLATQITTLQASTSSLAEALKSPTARGSWGENQLRNVIQLAGMEPYCDYSEQFTGGSSERSQRPDVVIRLPNGAFLAVDAKAPLAAYQRMQGASDPAQAELELKAHVKAIREHVKALADRRYWEQFPSAPDFVVMFIPGEGFVSDAMRHDPALLEDAMKSRVLIASPVNLLALLLAVAKGWQAHSVAEHAAKVAELGQRLHERVGTVLDKVTRMGNGLRTANAAYNDMVGSIESRMLVTMREITALGVITADEVQTPASLEVTPRELHAPEAGGELNSADDL